MPDVKARFPRGRMNESDKSRFMDEVTLSVARRLECLDYDGSPVMLAPDEIDVFLEPYDEGDVRLGSVFVIEITAYDYPDRMANIQERLGAIGADLSRESWLGHYPLPAGMKAISLSYVPLPDGCWTAVN